MVAKLSSYKESRKKRMEENKKRMETLNLHKLSRDLQVVSSPKRSPMKRVKPRTVENQVVEVRRSTRVASKPALSYKEVDIDRLVMTRRIYKRFAVSNLFYASVEAKAEAMEKAEKLLSDLETENPDYPSFVKAVLHSHVYQGFWLGLPVKFCKENLPKCDDDVFLIDEEGEKVSTRYLANKTGLSGGWRKFALDHELSDGDALIFQLINPKTFKVYIVRVNGSE